MRCWPYLKLGDVEIANSLRTLGYIRYAAVPGFDVPLADLADPTWEGLPFYAYGHSFMRSIVPYSDIDIALVADALGGVVFNNAVGGFKMTECATAAWQEPGVISRPNGTINGGPDGETYPTAKPYPIGAGGFLLIDCELNDGAGIGNVAKAVSGFKHGLRTLLALSQARSRISHFDFEYSGVWVDTFEAAGTRLDSNHYSVAAGSKATVEFAGSSCYLLGFTSDADVAGHYGSFDVTVDGSFYGNWDQDDQLKSFTSQDPVDPAVISFGPMAFKIEGLGSGVHVLELEATDSNPTLIKALLTPSNYPALAMVMKDSLTADAYNYLPGAKAAYDTAIDDVVAEFANAIIVDPDLASVPYDAATMTYDGVHPTADGHENLAAAILELMPGPPAAEQTVRCYCSTVDFGPFDAPQLDGAPWFDTNVDASAEFFGMIPDIDLQPVLTRRLGRRGTGGGEIGRAVAAPRIVQVSGNIFASSARGMSYGERWLRRALAGSVDECGNDSLMVLPSCDPTPLTTDTPSSTEANALLIKDVNGSNVHAADVSAVHIPNAAGADAHTADTAALSITGDIDLRAACALDDWTKVQVILSKWNSTGNQASYHLQIDADGKLHLVWSPDGTVASALGAASSIAAPGVDGELLLIRATLDVDNGAGGWSIRYYTKVSDLNTVTADLASNTGWTQLGSTQTTAGTTSIFNSTAALIMGAFYDGSSPASGRYYGVVVKNGIAGTTVAAPDFAGAASMPVVENGNSWSLAGTATFDAGPMSITGDIDIRVAVALDEWTRQQPLVSKWVTGTQGSYQFEVEDDTKLTLFWTPDGTDASAKFATSTVGITDGYPGTLHIVRVTLDVDNGSGQHVATFYKKPTTPETALIDASSDSDWIQVGASVTAAGTTSIFHSGSAVIIGNFYTGLLPSPGLYYAVVIKSGIAGTVVADPDFAHATSLPLVEHDNSWSATGSAALVGSPMTFTEDESRDLRELANVGLVDAPVYSDVLRDGACYVQRVIFQLAAGSPWLRRRFNSEVQILDNGFDIVFATIEAEMDMADSAAIVTITAGGSTLDGVVIEGRSGSCVQSGAADISYTINSLPADHTLVIDASMQSVVVTDADGMVVGSFDYLLFTGLFKWLIAAASSALCVSIDKTAATGLAGATLQIERIDLEA